ncbi:flagellar basal body P-ring protein FlgI [Aliidiomarina indica]|uniref:flagellar basal body P-ring protein FlgI n=1 Tax=Aliidiomarina indica TaxID=2749147 RepID=UPI00188DCF19|nr:flagellar basal body P-ring protein FlgI [Aliidiomarina indica]
MKRFTLQWILALSLIISAPAHAERLKDLADFAGVRDNVLVGYGLVVGLDGTGDQTTQAPFTGQSLTNMLSQLGVTVPPGTNMQLRNVAAVMVTADLPPFSRQGQRLDITVSSVGNARSLRGGTLLMTPLRGADGEIYALAQGNLLITGASAEAAGSREVINHQSAGRISRGAIVEREVPLDMNANGNGELELHLRTADFSTAERVVTRINQEFGNFVASAVDGRVIRLFGPQDDNERVRFMARVENLRVTPDEGRARVILNSRTGSVVLSGNVRLHQAAVAHGNLQVTIDTRRGVSQPGAFSPGQTVVVTEADVQIRQEDGVLNVVEGVELMEVVNALNALGATPMDLMAILEALKASGSLRADLEII